MTRSTATTRRRSRACDPPQDLAADAIAVAAGAVGTTKVVTAPFVPQRTSALTRLGEWRPLQ